MIIADLANQSCLDSSQAPRELKAASGKLVVDARNDEGALVASRPARQEPPRPRRRTVRKIFAKRFASRLSRGSNTNDARGGIRKA